MAVKIDSFRYESNCIPTGYACRVCGRKCKLYREYQTVLEHLHLFCSTCACATEGKKLDCDPLPDTIGTLVLAVPTEDGSSFWGYLSMDDAGYYWWKRLPS